MYAGKLIFSQVMDHLPMLTQNLSPMRRPVSRFQFFCAYKSWYWAGQFLDRWCKRTMRSRLEPMKKVARMLRTHRPLILN